MINVRDHGAVGDGLTDDSAAIQAAADAAAKELFVKKVFFPAGTYRTTKTIDLRGSELVGAAGFAVPALNEPKAPDE